MSDQQDGKPIPNPAMMAFSAVFARMADEATDPEEKVYNNVLSKKAVEAAHRVK